MTDAPPLILTLELAQPAQDWFQLLRDRHFPPNRNIVPAHVSLFHAIPADLEDALVWRLRAFAAPPPPVHVAPPFSLGRGVAYRLHAPDLTTLRSNLIGGWQARLTRQDAAPFRPHVTVQNKVSPEVARLLLTKLAADYAPLATTGAALRLWRYLGGPWEAAGRFAFTTSP